MIETVLAVFDDLEVGITIHDPETGAILGINSQLKSLYGYTEAELRTMTVGDYSATDEGYTTERARESIRAAADGEPQSFEWLIERVDGERIWTDVRLAQSTLDGEAYVLAEIRDITERKRRQQALRDERDFIEQSLEALQDAFYVLAPDGTLQRWNTALQEATGYSAAQLDGMHAVELFAEDDRPRITEAIDRALQDGTSVVEAPFVTADGQRIPHEFNGSRLTDSSGELRGVIGIGRDITVRKRQLERLETLQQAFRQLHETASSTDPFEQKVEELLAFGREYLEIEQGFLTRIDTDERIQEILVGVGPNEQLSTGATAPLEKSYCRHTLAPEFETPLTVLDAEAEGWADDPAFQQFGLGCYIGSKVVVDGETVGTICFSGRGTRSEAFTESQQTYVELLTEWAAYEIDRIERERQYRRLTERISDSYYAVDTEFTITYWNDVIADRIGIAAEAVVGRNLWECFPEIQQTALEASLREAMETQQPVDCEYYYEPADYWTALQIYPDEDGLAVISKDISDRKAYEQQLERSNERLQEFAYILSHDLQEPLRMVSSYVDLLETELDELLDDETREYMQFAVDGAERMRGMIDGLLQYSRVETEGQSFSETDVAAVVEGVRQDLQLVIAESDIELIVNSLPTVQADADQLGQVFQNLLSNAIDHGGNGTTIELSATEIVDGYRFAVSDDGPGIPDDQQEDIFGLFDKGTDSDSTGIGLAICERIIDRHNGEIWAESTEGEGSTFYFSIKTA